MSMQHLPIQLFCFLLILGMSCSGPSKPDPLLEEAFQVHKKSLAVAKEAKELLGQVPASNTYAAGLKSRLESWNDNLIEVPGFEHDHNHDHDHDHDHDHSAPQELNLSPEEMLAVQQNLLDSVMVIKNDLLAAIQQDTIQ